MIFLISLLPHLLQGRKLHMSQIGILLWKLFEILYINWSSIGFSNLAFAWLYPICFGSWKTGLPESWQAASDMDMTCVGTHLSTQTEYIYSYRKHSNEKTRHKEKNIPTVKMSSHWWVANLRYCFFHRVIVNRSQLVQFSNYLNLSFAICIARNLENVICLLTASICTASFSTSGQIFFSICDLYLALLQQLG